MSLDDKVDQIAEDVSAMKAVVSRTDREVWGNGRPSLSTQIAEQNTALSTQITGVKATQQLALKVLGAIGVAGLGLLATITVKVLFFGLQ